MTAAANDRLFFGVGTREMGHCWWLPGPLPRSAGPLVNGDYTVGHCPFNFEVDGRLQPGGDLRNVEGQCLLHLRAGWTAIAWWDRSGPDKRPGCCSAFVMRGEHSFDEMVAAFAQSFPWAYKRLTFALVLAEEQP